MAKPPPGKNDPPKKRIIEFDMFLRDLDSEDDENVRGGGKAKPAGQSNEDPAPPGAK